MTDPPPAPFFYLHACPQGHEELARLELRALTGGFSYGPVGWAQAGADIGRAAFVAAAARLLAAGADFAGMMAAAAKLDLAVERFRVTVHKRGGRFGPSSQTVERAVADLVVGRPDLSRPAQVFLVVATQGQWLLGALVSSYDKTWRDHAARPFQYSSALPPRFARALVNLVVRPGDRLLDPCCGVGTVLVEAATIGARACGWEINPRVAFHARANLRHHALDATVTCGDGTQVAGRFDGAVLDLPYGHSSGKDAALCRKLVAHAAEHARLLAVVAEAPMDRFLEDLGLIPLGTARVPKQHLVRHVHWLRSHNLNEPASGQGR